MIKDVLKEVESLDRRIGALEHPTAEDEAESQLLGRKRVPRRKRNPWTS